MNDQMDDTEKARMALAIAVETSDHLADTGNYLEALRLLQEEALPLCEGMEEQRAMAPLWCRVANLLGLLRMPADAIRILTEKALPAAEAVGDLWTKAQILFDCSGFRLDSEPTFDNLVIAKRELEESYALCESMGTVEGLAMVCGGLGQVLAALGQKDEALAKLRECIELCEKEGLIEESDHILSIIESIEAEESPLPC